MFDLLWLIPALPLAGFVVLALGGGHLTRRGIAIVGAGSVGLSALLAILIGLAFMANPPASYAYTQNLWTWLDVAGFNAGATLYLDALSVIMIVVVTVVAALIHLYSVEFMIDDEGYRRFFAYMNLFVAAMLGLVLADNLAILLIGWEGVGLCSYLLIGFWYRDPANGRAARKAFIVTRIGDAALLIGLILLFNNLGTLQIQPLMALATQNLAPGSALAVTAAALLLGGALGKSAQLPLQTWLPDAMAGPTPVSALIHAATMVTAGVYLIARTHALFTLAPSVMAAVAIIGAVTLIYAAFSALAQSDIKRALAYSTMSQVGYMFLALGAGAWSAAIFHFATHAFFKALLFLSAGIVIVALHHEQNVLQMGGLRRRVPLAFWTFLIGASSLSAVPLLTAGFYSKDLILLQVWASPLGGNLLYAVGAGGALLTSLYSFRLVFLAFCGDSQREAHYTAGLAIRLPVVTLAVLALLAGLVELPPSMGNVRLFSGFLNSALPDVIAPAAGAGVELILQAIAGAASLLGIYLAYRWFGNRRRYVTAARPWAARLGQLWASGWGFDWLYERLIVRPFVSVARILRDDVVDLLYQGIVWLAARLHAWLSATESGRVRRYALGIALGAVILVAIGIYV